MSTSGLRQDENGQLYMLQTDERGGQSRIEVRPFAFLREFDLRQVGGRLWLWKDDRFEEA